MAKKPGNGKTQLFNSIFGDTTVNTPFGKMPSTGSRRSGSAVSGSKGIDFDSSLLKRANERLRKLEKVNKLSSQSSAYQSIKRFAIDEPNSPSNKFYRVSDDGSIRFINKTQFKKLSRYEQRKYMETINNFLANETSTKKGISRVRTKSYNNFMENHPNLNWTQEEYEAFMKAKSQYDIDREDKERYNRLTQFLDDPTKLGGNNLTDKGRIDDAKIEEILSYINDERRYSKSPSKGKKRNYRK